MATQKNHTAVISTLSLEQNCALDFFSSSMLALAKNIKNIGGTTQTFQQSPEYNPSQSPVPGQSEDIFCINSVTEAMIAIIVDSELADRTTANTLIIPALYLRDLLPTDVQGSASNQRLHQDGNLHRAPASDDSLPSG